ncbi:MAG: 23S rRNA (guanosine(2251)-2'-O)-methyltransferase RlmB [Bacteroidetes bacterium]|nr:23S rRNA (guanosine(2251)-2'-O)-methyltransferase RlmB [Bacteroidota bacterium]
MFEKDNYIKKTPEDVIFGIRAVIEAIKSEREINKILIQKGLKKELFYELKEALAGKDLFIQYVPIEKINRVTSENHQGVIAYVSPVEYFEIETLVDERIEKGLTTKVLVLDRITDVRNFGAIARSAECMGIDTILVPKQGSVMVTADAVKTSAGALNRIPVCRTESLKNSLFYLQQSEFRIVSCTEKGNVPLYETNFRGSCAIIFGSEEDGITSDLLNLSDIKARIPMKGDIASLNVGVSVGMVLYEMVRQELYG